MRLIIAVVMFGLTAGVLYSSSSRHADNHKLSAAISMVASSSIKATADTDTAVTSPVFARPRTIPPIVVTAPTMTLIAPSTVATQTPSTSPVAPSPTSTPRSHLFYTSSSTRAKYYYCDTDHDWQNLAKDNLKTFTNEPELLRAYPSRTLHLPCK